MKSSLITIGKGQSSWAQEAAMRYLERLQPWIAIDEKKLSSSVFRDNLLEVKQKEAKEVEKVLQPRDVVVALDEHGERMTTLALADWVQAQYNQGAYRLVWVIGGAYGLDATVLQRAQLILRLSDFTLNHEVAKVMLCEQLYRVWSVLNRSPYHHV